ncbi:hypothetical protein NQ315_000324 [Exocentrus adspersus]|uniref:Serine palmitoyltransferase 1 n=1 Tax=Exocentrus adspersus TaxID=1586481 RepID=A0AAV8VRQ0_9CUCU|nr:hypothetical protein NQ315_000324 [Exocentrus adspersus]
MLDEKLLQERLAQFQPEPLVQVDGTKTKEDIESYVNRDDAENVDLAKVNFLDVLNNDEIKRSCESIIRKYGVGTCGPRAFYGTTDVHLELEERLAQFMRMDEAIVYSYGFVAISSSIAAYCKRNDVVFVDKETNFPIGQGLAAARCKVVYYDHNNPDSFRREALKLTEKEKNRKTSRKFLIAEGVSWKTGKLLPLEQFLLVAEEFKMRVFLEESYSIGIYGEHGRGLTEHFNIDPTRIDMVIATLETAIGSIGGFCAGSHTAIEHQRLSGAGYIFSASLPTYLVQACLESVRILGEKPKQLRALAVEFHQFLTNTCKFQVISDQQSAFKLFASTGREENDKIWKFCKENGVHFLRNDDGLVVNLNVALYQDKTRLQKVYQVLEKAASL